MTEIPPSSDILAASKTAFARAWLSYAINRVRNASVTTLTDDEILTLMGVMRIPEEYAILDLPKVVLTNAEYEALTAPPSKQAQRMGKA